MNRTWADAAVEISSEVMATMGPIGLGVVVIVGTLGVAIWIADKRGWMRPLAKNAPAIACKAIDLDRMERALSALEYKLGSNDAKHDVTHDMIREIRRELR